MASSEYQRINRLKKRITNMLKNNNNCYFLTFTFRNHVIESKNQLKRLRYVKDYLNDFANEYILNIDYGKTTKREHYHAIATPKYKLFLYNFFNEKYGYMKAELIGQKRFANINKSIEETAERLTNHALKETTENNKIIYSRKNNKPIDPQIIEHIDTIIELAEMEREEKARQEEYKRIEKLEEDMKNGKITYFQFIELVNKQRYN